MVKDNAQQRKRCVLIVASPRNRPSVLEPELHNVVILSECRWLIKA